MTTRTKPNLRRERGFSLMEMLIVLAIFTLVMGAAFAQMGTAMQRMNKEQVRVDYNGEVRDFVDQFFRDINQIGDPNPRMFSFSFISPAINDHHLAVGLTKIDANELHFEGSTNGVGTVQSLTYMVNGSGSCALCLQRSQVDKQDGDPLTGQVSPNWGTEVNDVVTNPIFTYYDTTGTQITSLPVDISTTAGQQTIATVKTIHISLQVRDPLVVDEQTGQPIEGTFEGEVSLNNCSMVATGLGMSCQ